MRLVEAWGLWFDRRWASWLGALSGALYVPIELYELAAHPSSTELILLAVNVCVVVYLGRRLLRKGRGRRR